MAVRVKVDPIERDILVVFPDYLSPEARSRQLAEFAVQELHKAEEQNRRVLGRVPPHERWVDGREGVPETSVKPDGQVIYEFELLEELFFFIRDLLEETSPIGKGTDKRPGHPGLYKKSHAFFIDNEFFELGSQPLPKSFDRATFVNTQPYARKLEGYPNRPPLSLQAPHGVYQVVAKKAHQRFSNLARIRFTYEAPMFGAIDEWAQTTSMESQRSAAGRADWLRRNPAIIIEP
ncbi:hypothetical protein [Microvirga massiliensis]|uniref:hypothetical protein n=1 Tax=Microvirga massiliensis TaxID=1033741 RepID=UPI00062B4967|nr:hypothetical protein [Microvirga massiliensis]